MLSSSKITFLGWCDYNRILSKGTGGGIGELAYDHLTILLDIEMGEDSINKYYSGVADVTRDQGEV